MVAAAVIGAAVVGAGASAASAHSASSATKSASNSAISEQQAARTQSAELSAPYRALGEKAMGTYEDLLGIGPKGAAGIQETLSQLPGYQFAKTQGIEGTSRALAAQGMNLSGNQATALADYTTGLADQTYGEQLNRLLAPVQLGQASAAGQASNVLTTAGNISNIQQNQGQTLAGIKANEAAGINNAVVGGVDNYMTYKTLQGLQSPGTGMAGPTYIPSNTAGEAGFVGPVHG